MLPSTLNKREASFGFGQKEILSLGQRKNAIENPCSVDYSDIKFHLNYNSGKSFGLGH